MTKVQAEDILLGEAYSSQRESIRERVMQAKMQRRVRLGEHLTFLFENRETIAYQVQEMLHLEKRHKAEDVENELEAYNELLGEPGWLSCTLLIEIEDPEERSVKLQEWFDLVQHLYVELDCGHFTPAVYDERQAGDDSLSPVQYLQFDCRKGHPVALSCELPSCEQRAELSKEQVAAFISDMG